MLLTFDQLKDYRGRVAMVDGAFDPLHRGHIEYFRSAAEAKDFSAIEEIFSADVVFRSPVVFKPYEGRDAVAALLAAVVQVFEDFRYTDQVETGDAAALAFSARVGDREVDGIDFLRFDGDGMVTELAVYVRPLSGINALAEAMQRKLEEMGAPTGS